MLLDRNSFVTNQSCTGEAQNAVLYIVAVSVFV